MYYGLRRFKCISLFSGMVLAFLGGMIWSVEGTFQHQFISSGLWAASSMQGVCVAACFVFSLSQKIFGCQSSGLETSEPDFYWAQTSLPPLSRSGPLSVQSTVLKLLSLWRCRAGTHGALKPSAVRRWTTSMVSSPGEVIASIYPLNTMSSEPPNYNFYKNSSQVQSTHENTFRSLPLVCKVRGGKRLYFLCIIAHFTSFSFPANISHHMK